MAAVNELSGHIELESTLIRAEALFRRFQRSVEAIDKRQNFPAPSVRPRNKAPQAVVRTISSSDVVSGSSTPTTSSAHDAARDTASAKASGNDATTVANTKKAESEDSGSADQAISSQLRDLLSRKIPKLEKTEIRAHGGGIN